MYMYVNKRVELAQQGIALYKMYVLLLLMLNAWGVWASQDQSLLAHPPGHSFASCDDFSELILSDHQRRNQSSVSSNALSSPF